MTVSEADPAIMEPRAFSRLIRNTPAEELTVLMHGPRRTQILHELLRRMPGVLRRERARGLDAVIHWHIGDRPDGGADVYQLVITDGVGELSPEPSREPRLTLRLGAADFVRLVTGNVHAVMLVMKGRLKTTGDPVLTAKFPTLFDIPKP